MKTLTTIRSICFLIVGCLLCMAVAVIGFYPFAASRRGRESRAVAYVRTGIKAMIA